uniref:PH domain-containing protein n=1 Tax=Anopheles farauti TaxID=69004 RepID=A0A182QI74_9DIPT
MAMLEGTLSKWTNVMKGWQYRWFVLDENAGLLSYYTMGYDVTLSSVPYCTASTCENIICIIQAVYLKENGIMVHRPEWNYLITGSVPHVKAYLFLVTVQERKQCQG